MFALGCTAAALVVLADRASGSTQTAEVHRRLAVKAEQLFQSLEARVDDPTDAPLTLKLRAEAVVHMGRCAHAAVVACAGAANLSDHAAQRIWREALLFTVLSQTSDVRAASLQALVDPLRTA
jgi:hypothetical protein